MIKNITKNELKEALVAAGADQKIIDILEGIASIKYNGVIVYQRDSTDKDISLKEGII